MAVRVRLFASLRDAAGSAEVEAQAGPLTDVLDDLRRRYGEPFSARLAVSSILVDGDAVSGAAVAAVDVADGSEVVLLPPVSGGAGPARGPLLDCGTR